MDNQSSDSQHEVEINVSQTKKPNNRRKFSHKGLYLNSDFAGGNLQAASFQEEFRIEGKVALVVQFWGNSDAQSDPLDKSWFYFQVTGIKETRNIKYQQIIFRFKNANNYRKFIRQKKFKPYVLVKQQSQQPNNKWSTVFISKINILQNQVIQAQFVYSVQQGVNKVLFAQNIPYSLQDLQSLHQRNIQYLESEKISKIFYHRQIIAHTVDGFPVYMFTITSSSNILSYQQSQPQIWPTKDQRPYLLKHRPEIVICARVHPSESSSSYTVQGILDSLIKCSDFQVLLHIFIFRIVPMINVDGVQNGHYRLDNYLQNLNRYYGHSDITKTPQIYSLQKFISHLREKQKLFLFIDIHGHNSPKPSFIYGNFTQDFNQILQNRTFVRIMQLINDGNFDSFQCQFSKKNMSIKQKYDQHSKQASARVFAYRGNTQQQNYQFQLRSQMLVQHSYTLEIHPYIIQNISIRRNLIRKQSKQGSSSYKNLPKAAVTVKKIDSFSGLVPPSGEQIVYQYKKIGENTLISIMQLIGVNFCGFFPQNQDGMMMRKRVFKQLSKLIQFYEKSRKYKSKEINKQVFDRYYQKWNFFQGFKQFLSQQNHTLQNFKSKAKMCPMYQSYQQWNQRKQKLQQANAKRNKLLQKQKQKGQQKQTNLLQQALEEEMMEKKQKDQYRQNISQNDQEKYTIISFPNSKPQFTNQRKSLKSVQTQLLQKRDRNQIQQLKQGHRFMNSPQTGTSVSLQKRAVNSRVSDISQLEKKIRKIIFRHRTQSQIDDDEQQQQKKVSYPFNIPRQTDMKKTDIQYNKKGAQFTYLKQVEKQYIASKLQPLSRQKTNRLMHMKTQQNRFQRDFNDKKIIDKMDTQTQFNQKKSQNVDEYSNPRIQQFMRKITKQKLQLQTIMHESTQQQQAYKGKQAQQNTFVNRQKKSQSRNQEKKDNQQRNRIIHGSQSTKNNPAFQSNMILPPMHPIIIQQDILAHSDNMILMQGRLTGCHKSIKSKLKKVEIIKNRPSDQQVQQIVKSFKNLASESSNRVEFVQKARRMLSQKKKQYKTVQQQNLPTLGQIQYIKATLSRKSKY